MHNFSHVIRLFGIFIVIGIVCICLRSFFIPESFGIYRSYKYGYHRGDSDREQEALPALYQGKEKCRKCHNGQFDELKDSGHASLACELCHGYWKAHNNNTKGKVPKDRSAQLCLQCHQKLKARPETFPQIVSFAQHMKEQEQEMEPDLVCVDCHSPHAPL